jgi:hypothetical protein
VANKLNVIGYASDGVRLLRAFTWISLHVRSRGRHITEVYDTQEFVNRPPTHSKQTCMYCLPDEVYVLRCNRLRPQLREPVSLAALFIQDSPCLAHMSSG